MDRTVKAVSLATLTELDPKIDRVVAEQIKRAVRDCRERPELEKARVIKLQIELIPIFEDGECADINMQIFVDDKHPPRRTRVYRVGANKQNQLFFAPDNPEDISQTGLFEGGNE